MAAARLAVLIVGLCLGLSCAAASIAPGGTPRWTELDERERAVLAPLQDEWNGMAAVQRRKWLGIAGRYDRLSADEQMRMQARMRDWARLHPDERNQARDRYRALRNMPPERRGNLNAEWERYQNLPPEARKPRAIEAPLRPDGAVSGQENQ